MTEHLKKSPEEAAAAFADLFGGLENALRHSGFCKKERDHAEADWTAFSKLLGEKFFEEVRDSGKAHTLVAAAPRKQKRENLRWTPDEPVPVTNVEELFVKGVCKVRNHIVHRQKFRGSEEDVKRDLDLIADAQWVLELVLEKNPKLKEHL